MNILITLLIIIGLVIVIYDVIKKQALTKDWLIGLICGYTLIVLGLCLSNIYIGYKNIAIILLAFLGIATMMKTKVNIIYQVLINVVLVVVAVSVIALLNNAG